MGTAVALPARISWRWRGKATNSRSLFGCERTIASTPVATRPINKAARIVLAVMIKVIGEPNTSAVKERSGKTRKRCAASPISTTQIITLARSR